MWKHRHRDCFDNTNADGRSGKIARELNLKVNRYFLSIYYIIIVILHLNEVETDFFRLHEYKRRYERSRKIARDLESEGQSQMVQYFL